MPGAQLSSTTGKHLGNKLQGHLWHCSPSELPDFHLGHFQKLLEAPSNVVHVSEALVTPTKTPQCSQSVGN